MENKNMVLLSDHMDISGVELLKKHFDVQFSKNQDDFSEKAKDANALVIVRSGKATKEVIEKSAGLKVICKHGVGYDSIDVDAAKQKGIYVSYTPEANFVSVAEHCITLFLMLAKKIHTSDMLLRNGKWKADIFDFLGVDLDQKTMGILGFGRIGRRLARICRGFGMNIIFYDIVNISLPADDSDIKQVSIDEVFSASDFISINLPLTPETRGLVNRDKLKKMKKTAFLINTGRGPLFVEKDLYEALTNGWIAGAASDVYEKEPTPEDNPLFKLDNFIGTPHIAAHTEESMRRSSLMVAEDVVAVLLEGKQPKYLVPEWLK